jgi:hypothetical protein
MAAKWLIRQKEPDNPYFPYTVQSVSLGNKNEKISQISIFSLVSGLGLIVS